MVVTSQHMGRLENTTHSVAIVKARQIKQQGAISPCSSNNHARERGRVDTNCSWVPADTSPKEGTTKSMLMSQRFNNGGRRCIEGIQPHGAGGWQRDCEELWGKHN